jgi:hypothetical protein
MGGSSITGGGGVESFELSILFQSIIICAYLFDEDIFG